jgi:hypothetical protein
MNDKTPIIKKASSSKQDVTIKDILLSGITSSDDTNLYMDRGENSGIFSFNLMINNVPASNFCKNFYMALVPGKGNEKGLPETYITGSVVETDTPDTIVKFVLPFVDRENIFSYHENGYSCSKYFLYCSINEPPVDYERTSNNPGEVTDNILLSTGKIIRTDIVYDAVESGI